MVPTVPVLVGNPGDPKFAAQTAPPESNDDLRSTFGDVFMRWRGGDDSLLEDVRSLAGMMCTQFNRCDIPKGVEHYAALSSEERARGLELELQVDALRGRLDFAFSEGLRNEEWVPIQLQIERDIEALHALTRGVADRTARGQASALRAEYYAARLNQNFSRQLDPEARSQLAQRVEADAREAVEHFNSFDSVKGSLNPRLTLARIEFYRGHLGSAQASYQQLATDAARINHREKMAEAQEGLLRIARERGDEPEAERCLKALADLRVSTVNWPLAHAWSMQLIHRDRPEDAIRFLERFQAPPIQDNSASGRAIRRHLAFTLAEAHLRSGNLPMARSQALIAASIEDDEIDDDEFDEFYLEGRIRLAERQPDVVVSILGDPGFLALLDPREEGAVRTLLGEARLDLDDPLGAKKDLARALVLADQASRRVLDQPLVSHDEMRRFNLVGEWEGAGLESVALMVRAHLACGEDALAALTSEEWQSRSLRGSADELARLEALTGESSRCQPLTIGNLESWASSFELGLVTWVFGADSGAVVHVRAGSPGGMTALGEPIELGREAMLEAVRRLREHAIAGLDTEDIAREIGDALLPARIREHIGKPDNDKDRLLLLVHGPLEYMPFELLGLGEHDFDDQLCLVMLPGLPAAQPGEHAEPEAFRDWSLLGAPIDGRDGEGPPKILLKGAGEELTAIAQLHPKSVRTPEFRRRDLEEAILSRRSLHVATHLEVKPGESHSRFPAAGLRLDDEDVASALDIADLGPNLPLVVLSACETGGGRYSDGEGLFGVSRAFLEGGTRNLIVTLWPVEDGAAKDFSIAFHRALAEGAAPSQATRAARKVLRAADRRSADWAAFRFLGRD